MAAARLHPTSEQIVELAKISGFWSWRSPAGDSPPPLPAIHHRTDDLDAPTAVDHSVDMRTSIDRS
jgi:hypothetical protein